MATTSHTTSKPAARSQKSSVDYLQQAIQDVDKARERAGEELKGSLDSAADRLREVVADLRERAERQASEWDDALDQATEDLRRELGRRAVMAQRTPEALTEIRSAVRKRSEELTAQQ